MSRSNHLTEVLTRAVHTRPDQTAIICADRTCTFAELSAASHRIANALLAADLGDEPRVAYLGRETEAFYAIVFGCAASGVVLVPVNWRLTSDEIDHILRDSGASLVFADDDMLRTVEHLREGLPALRTVVPLRPDALRAWSDPFPDTAPARPHPPDEPVCQLYTSGTTGLPKGVVLANQSFFAVPDLSHEGNGWMEWHAGDTGLVGMPAIHIGGLSYAAVALDAGSTLVVLPVFDSRDVVRSIVRHQVNTMILTPAMLGMVLAEPAATREALASLRTVVYAGSPIPLQLMEDCIARMDCALLQLYGSTETGNVITVLPPHDHVAGTSVLRSAGRPCSPVRLKVVDGEGNTAPTGEIGEVWVRTPSMMREYWHNPDATARTITDGWLRMGDVGYLDEDGYLFLCDRLNDTIIVAGENIYPIEVENALGRHPAVADVAVLGVPDPDWGERVHACVVLRQGGDASPYELRSFLRGRIADFKIPASLSFVADVPRNPTGKILRRELRSQVPGQSGVVPT